MSNRRVFALLTKLLVFLLLLGGAAGHSSPATAKLASGCYQDWPTYGGTLIRLRNATCADRFNGVLQRKWTTDMNGVLEMPPSASHGVLYVAQDDGRVSAVKAATGALLWQTNLHSLMADSPSIWWGGGLAYVESRGPGHALFAIRLGNGKVAWKTHSWGAGEATPVFVKTKRGPRVYAVNSAGWLGAWQAKTGRATWRHWIGPPSYQKRYSLSLMGSTPLPTVAPDDPLVDATKPCVINPKPPPHSGGGGGNGSAVYRLKYTGSPVYHDGVLYMANYGGDVWAITDKGHVRWHRTVNSSSVYAAPAYANGNLFLVSRGGIAYSLRAKTGELRWRTNIGYLPYGSPALAGGALYTSSYDGSFWKLSMVTGRVLWHYSTPGMPENTAPVVVGGRVFFGVHGSCPSQHGSIIAFRTTSMKRVFSFDDGRYSPVVISGDSLVLVGFHTLYGFAK